MNSQSGPEQFSVLVIDADLQRRERLKACLEKIPFCLSVCGCEALEEGLLHIKYEDEFRYIFIADSFPEVGLISLMAQARQFYGGYKTALLLLGNAQSGKSVADWQGFADAWLGETFDVSTLQEIFSKLRKIQKKRTHQQICQAIRLLVTEVADQIDAVAGFRGQGSRAAISRHLLKEVCGVLKDLPANYQQVYWESCIDIFAARGEGAGSVVAEASQHTRITAPVRMVELQQLLKELAA